MSATKTAYAAPTTISMLTDEQLLKTIRQVFIDAMDGGKEVNLTDDDERLYKTILAFPESAQLAAEVVLTAIIGVHGRKPNPQVLVTLFEMGARIQRAIDAEAMKVPTGKAN